MSTDRDRQLAQIRDEIRGLINAIHELGEQEKEVVRRIDAVERNAMAAGATDVEIALRNAYTKIVDAGHMLVAAHLALTSMPGAPAPDNHTQPQLAMPGDEIEQAQKALELRAGEAVRQAQR